MINTNGLFIFFNILFNNNDEIYDSYSTLILNWNSYR